MNNNDYIVGIGAANVDIYAKSRIKIRSHYDHPANISSNVGGVCKNILTNISKLNINSKFITALGDDVYGKMILDNCKLNNIDTCNSLIVEDATSGVFMQVQDDNNDMYLAMCDMSILENVTPEYLRSKTDLLLNAKLVLFDPSLKDEAIKELLNICKDKVDVYMDPISDNYAIKMRPYVKDITCIKPNLSELENLSDIKINNREDLEKACEKLLKQGLKKIYVSLGKNGILYMDADEKLYRKLKPVDNMVNASGAGDSAMAAIIYGNINNMDNEDILNYAMAAGISAISVEETVNKDLSIELLEKIIKENKI